MTDAEKALRFAERQAADGLDAGRRMATPCPGEDQRRHPEPRSDWGRHEAAACQVAGCPFCPPRRPEARRGEVEQAFRDGWAAVFDASGADGDVTVEEAWKRRERVKP